MGIMLDKQSEGLRPSVPFLSLLHLLEVQRERNSEAQAIIAPGRPPLTYGGLYRQVLKIKEVLREMGIGAHDRMAVALPNGPDAVVAILAAAVSAACAPINPA